MRMRTKAFLLGSAVLFSAMADAQAAGNVQKIRSDNDDNVVIFKSVDLRPVPIKKTCVRLRSIDEIRTEQQALANLINESYDSKIPDELMRYKEKFEIEMTLAKFREIETKELSHHYKQIEKLQRISYNESRQIERNFFDAIEEIGNGYKEILANYGIDGTECAANLKSYNLANRDNNRKSGKITSFFKKIKNGVKAILPRWLTLR